MSVFAEGGKAYTDVQMKTTSLQRLRKPQTYMPISVQKKVTSPTPFSELVGEFLCPSAAYRGKPFWAWNSKLEEQELRSHWLHLKNFGV